ncbi:hypothetical protein D3C78_1796100 [compost metagenome]
MQFDHDNLDIFSDQLVDILELKYELFNLLGVNEGRSLSQDEKERLKKSFIEGITNQS